MVETTQERAQNHTPGPWTLAGEISDAYNELEILGPDNEIVGTCNMMPPTDLYRGCGTETPELNARLLAAAPKLLAALEDMVEAHENQSGRYTARQRALKALALARSTI